MSSSYRGKPVEQINRSMKTLLPETSGCTFADYPMNHGKKWLSGKDKAPKGGFCFIKTEDKMPTDKGVKTGYVWGTGPFGYGYYHLRTKAAHITLYQRIHNKKVFTGASSTGVCCGCFGSGDDPNVIPTTLPTIPAGDMDDLRLLFHARSVASEPNDAKAHADQLSESKATAQAHYQYDQNIALGHGIANTAYFVAQN
jgi:hypothetical protein